MLRTVVQFVEHTQLLHMAGLRVGALVIVVNHQCKGTTAVRSQDNNFWASYYRRMNDKRSSPKIKMQMSKGSKVTVRAERNASGKKWHLRDDTSARRLMFSNLDAKAGCQTLDDCLSMHGPSQPETAYKSRTKPVVILVFNPSRHPSKKMFLCPTNTGSSTEPRLVSTKCTITYHPKNILYFNLSPHISWAKKFAKNQMI